MTAGDPAPVAVQLEAVIVAVTDESPRVLTVAGEPDLLPSGPLDPALDRTLDRALRRWVEATTGIEVGYVEQLYTLGDRDRHPAERSGGPRLLSISYLALVHEEQPAPGAEWRDWYDYFPWEDHRDGRPAIIDADLRDRLRAWVDEADDAEARDDRVTRAQISFGLGPAPWDEVRALERYELLYEIAAVPEWYRDRGRPVPAGLPAGREMGRDHRRIAAIALNRLRGKLGYRPVVFELMPETFTLLQLQRVVEALAGVRLHKQNFRRLVESGGLVEGTGELDHHTGGRPAELFRFRREVLRERPRPGVRIPRPS